MERGVGGGGKERKDLIGEKEDHFCRAQSWQEQPPPKSKSSCFKSCRYNIIILFEHLFCTEESRSQLPAESLLYTLQDDSL